MITRYYESVITTALTKENFLAAQKFAEQVTSTTNYQDSNQFVQKKIRDDHYISKLGEEAVKRILSIYGVVKGPDYSIYTGSNKSWEDDLFINEEGIAVKTQKRSAALKYGLSWTFQAGTLRRDKLLERPAAWVAFVEYDDVTSHTFRVYPLFQIKKLTFKDPVLQHLKGHKLVVYADTLPLLKS